MGDPLALGCVARIDIIARIGGGHYALAIRCGVKNDTRRRKIRSEGFKIWLRICVTSHLGFDTGGKLRRHITVFQLGHGSGDRGEHPNQSHYGQTEYTDRDDYLD